MGKSKSMWGGPDPLFQADIPAVCQMCGSDKGVRLRVRGKDDGAQIWLYCPKHPPGGAAEAGAKGSRQPWGYGPMDVEGNYPDELQYYEPRQEDKDDNQRDS